MKKILMMLAVLGTVHFGASAQVGTGSYNNDHINQGDQGEKINVVEGRNNSTSNQQGTTTPATNTTVHTTAVYHHTTAVHHAYGYHKPMHHAVHHTYAKASIHKTTVHRTTHAVALHRTMKHGYSGNRMQMNTNNSRNTYSGTTNTPALVTPPVKQNADVNRKIPDTPYPGGSNGGWSNGTNGKGGTNSEDGTIRTDRNDN
jgi:hypothetical protein